MTDHTSTRVIEGAPISADEPRSTRLEQDDEPDPRLLWRWVGAALRPWVGWILIGAGALLMLLGYFGVSRESIPAKQIPYLVSGGIGGVFLAVLGAYFLGTQEMRNDSGRLDRLEQMVEELHHALLRRPDAPAPVAVRSAETNAATVDTDAAPAAHPTPADLPLLAGSNGSPPSPTRVAPTTPGAPTTPAAPAATRRVVVVEAGELFHRASCALVAGKGAEDLSLATARRRGLKPCPVCSPVAAAAVS